MRVDRETLEVLLNAKDVHGNSLSYNEKEGMVYLKTQESGKSFSIGQITIESEDPFMITLTKHENIDQFQRNLFAWSINAALSELCDSFVYIAGGITFKLDKISMLQNKIEKSWGGKGLDKKIYVPLRCWEVSSTDDAIQKRLNLFGIEWYLILQHEISQPYFRELSKRVNFTRKTKLVFPDREDVFRAFKLTPYSAVKAVIIGQDPYHDGSASGLAFGVKGDAIKTPPSLQNILKEMEDDVGQGLLIDVDPTLQSWAEQGVFLINTKLTVNAGEPNSHTGWGWEGFIIKVIEKLNEQVYGEKKPIVFILWGKNAQSLESLIHHGEHHVIKSPHPSPYSAATGFFGSKPFSKTNEFLTLNGLTPIQWTN